MSGMVLTRLLVLKPPNNHKSLTDALSTGNDGFLLYYTWNFLEGKKERALENKNPALKDMPCKRPPSRMTRNFEQGKNHDGYWNGELFTEQMKACSG